MAKQFAGFTPQQTAVLLQKMGYTGSSDSKAMQQFLASNPAAAARLGKYTETAQRMIAGQPAAKTMPPAAAMGMQEGGVVIPTAPTAPAALPDPQSLVTGIGISRPDIISAATNILTKGETPSSYTLQKNATGGFDMVFDNGTVVPTGFTKQSDADWNANAIIRAAQSYSTKQQEQNAFQELQNRYQQDVQAYTTQAQTQAAATLADPPALANLQNQLNTATIQRNQYLQEIQNLPANDPRRSTLSTIIAEADKNINALQQQVTTLGSQQLKAGQQELLTKAYTAPEELVTKAEAAPVSEAATQAGMIAAGTGSLGAAPTVGATTVSAGQAATPEAAQAYLYDAVKATPGVESVVQQTKAVTGTVSPDAQVTAQTMDSSTLAQLGMTAEQLATAQTVKAPPPREVQAGELISGPAVDMARVEELVSNVQAAEATPSDMATVQGQMAQLLQQFEGKEPPAWAAGAMRKATATLAARGLGASSMAGQAIVQAAMESALPIAMQDAQTRASFEAQNLSNRQQVAMFAAQQRASFLGMEFDQQFQARVQNAARIADIANMNFSADVQIALENSRNAQSVDLANLNARNAKLLADLAAMTQVDLTNLNNRQQAAVQNAASFLQMDMQNLTNAQQTMMFNSQARVQALLTDAASENASRQFNATSQMQVDQFNKNLAAQIDQFNTAQANAVAQFNAQEANAIAKFNAEVKNARDVFEAQNALVIAQSNAKWRQEITTLETQQQHQANMQAAAAATQMTQATIESVWQRERDTMAFAFQASENAADRATQIAVAKLTADEQAKLQDNIGKGTLAATVLDKTLDWALNQ
jgi:hypothetical protein